MERTNEVVEIVDLDEYEEKTETTPNSVNLTNVKFNMQPKLISVSNAEMMNLMRGGVIKIANNGPVLNASTQGVPNIVVKTFQPKHELEDYYEASEQILPVEKVTQVSVVNKSPKFPSTPKPKITAVIQNVTHPKDVINIDDDTDLENVITSVHITKTPEKKSKIPVHEIQQSDNTTYVVVNEALLPSLTPLTTANTVGTTTTEKKLEDCPIIYSSAKNTLNFSTVNTTPVKNMSKSPRPIPQKLIIANTATTDKMVLKKATKPIVTPLKRDTTKETLITENGTILTPLIRIQNGRISDANAVLNQTVAPGFLPLVRTTRKSVEKKTSRLADVITIMDEEEKQPGNPPAANNLVKTSSSDHTFIAQKNTNHLQLKYRPNLLKAPGPLKQKTGLLNSTVQPKIKSVILKTQAKQIPISQRKQVLPKDTGQFNRKSPSKSPDELQQEAVFSMNPEQLNAFRNSLPKKFIITDIKKISSPEEKPVEDAAPEGNNIIDKNKIKILTTNELNSLFGRENMDTEKPPEDPLQPIESVFFPENSEQESNSSHNFEHISPSIPPMECVYLDDSAARSNFLPEPIIIADEISEKDETPQTKSDKPVNEKQRKRKILVQSSTSSPPKKSKFRGFSKRDNAKDSSTLLTLRNHIDKLQSVTSDSLYYTKKVEILTGEAEKPVLRRGRPRKDKLINKPGCNIQFRERDEKKASSLRTLPDRKVTQQTKEKEKSSAQETKNKEKDSPQQIKAKEKDTSQQIKAKEKHGSQPTKVKEKSSAQQIKAKEKNLSQPTKAKEKNPSQPIKVKEKSTPPQPTPEGSKEPQHEITRSSGLDENDIMLFKKFKTLSRSTHLNPYKPLLVLDHKNLHSLQNDINFEKFNVVFVVQLPLKCNYKLKRYPALMDAIRDDKILFYGHKTVCRYITKNSE